MAHQFPDIASYGSALRFALEAEQACADFAAAAGVLAPDQTWRDKLEEIVCTHDDRVQKLTSLREEMGTRASDPVGSLDRGTYLGTLDAEPVTQLAGRGGAAGPGRRSRGRVPRGVRRAVRLAPGSRRARLREERQAGPRRGPASCGSMLG